MTTSTGYVQDYAAAPDTRHALLTSVARLWLSDVIPVDVPEVARMVRALLEN